MVYNRSIFYFHSKIEIIEKNQYLIKYVEEKQISNLKKRIF